MTTSASENQLTRRTHGILCTYGHEARLESSQASHKISHCREAFFDSVIVRPHGMMYQAKASFLDGEQAGVRVTI
jgi:hypothetical protein